MVTHTCSVTWNSDTVSRASAELRHGAARVDVGDTNTPGRMLILHSVVGGDRTLWANTHLALESAGFGGASGGGSEVNPVLNIWRGFTERPIQSIDFASTALESKSCTSLSRPSHLCRAAKSSCGQFGHRNGLEVQPIPVGQLIHRSETHLLGAHEQTAAKRPRSWDQRLDPPCLQLSGTATSLFRSAEIITFFGFELVSVSVSCHEATRREQRRPTECQTAWPHAQCFMFGA